MSGPVVQKHHPDGSVDLVELNPGQLDRHHLNGPGTFAYSLPAGSAAVINLTRTPADVPLTLLEGPDVYAAPEEREHFRWRLEWRTEGPESIIAGLDPLDFDAVPEPGQWAPVVAMDSPGGVGCRVNVDGLFTTGGPWARYEYLTPR